MHDDKVHYLNGLRGLLAISVFLHHFSYAFYPDLVFGGSYDDFLAGKWTLCRIIAYSPLNLLSNTGMSINFFFLLSGYVQSYHYFKKNEAGFIRRSFIKRYFRLAIPTLVVVLLVFVFHRLSLIDKDHFPTHPLSDPWIKTMLPDNMNFLEVLNYALVNCFNGAHDYYQVLWTMPSELYNSWMVLILLLVTHRIRNRSFVFILWILAQIFLLQSFYGVSFSLGMFVCMLHQRAAKFNGFFSRPFLKGICLVLGLYFASYPNTGYETSAQRSMYNPISFFDVYPHVISYIFGNLLLFLLLLHSPALKKLLSKRILLFFGRISFMFYLIHFLLLFSFSPWLYQKLGMTLVNTATLWLTAFISFMLITGVSYLLYKWVDQPVIKLCDRSVKRVFGL